MAIYDFKRDDLSMFDEHQHKEWLAAEPEQAENHLTMAHSLEVWAQNLEEDYGHHSTEERSRGYADALREVAAHLRQGDFRPGGQMMHQE